MELAGELVVDEECTTTDAGRGRRRDLVGLGCDACTTPAATTKGQGIMMLVKCKGLESVRLRGRS